MHRRSFWFGGVILPALVLVAGCGRSDSHSSSTSESKSSALSAPPVLQVDWAGKKALAANPQATNLLTLWNLPESLRLEKRMLDKLALAPWRLLKSDAATNGAPVGRLRPLLDDLVSGPAQLTIQLPTNQPATVRLAVHLDAVRGALWQTNLPIVLESLFGASQTTNSQNLAGSANYRLQTSDFRVDLTRTNDWTVLTLSPGRADAFLPSPPSSNWLAITADLSWLLPKLGVKWSPPPGWPRAIVHFNSDQGGVKTRAQLDFPQPLDLVLSPWNVPTNLIHDPLMTFTAIRGLEQWWPAGLWATDPNPVPPANQFFSWAAMGLPHLSFFAVPHPNSRELVARWSEQLIRDGNPWLTNHAMGYFKHPTDADGLVWADCAFLAVNLRAAQETSGDYVVGGLFKEAPSKSSFPSDLAVALNMSTNLVAYDWELTGERVNSLLYVGQLFRVIFNQAQLSSESVGIPWLKAVAPQLGNGVTTLTSVSPRQMSFVRQSSLGLSAIEIQVLVDWVESPRFPLGLNTFESPASLPRMHP